MFVDDPMSERGYGMFEAYAVPNMPILDNVRSLNSIPRTFAHCRALHPSTMHFPCKDLHMGSGTLGSQTLHLPQPATRLSQPPFE